MTTGKTLHLSRLSRGVGEEYPKYSHIGHNKVHVYLEPQDYFNLVETSRKVFQLSAIPNGSKTSSVPHSIAISANTNNASLPITNKEIILPKTFTTRKGALLLFSEVLANKNRTWENSLEDEGEREDDGEQVARNDGQEEKQGGENSEIDLRTVGEFTKSILAYGNQHQKRNYVQLLTRIDKLQRQFRPGFSAKRYLSVWSKFWDHSTLDKLLKNGHIQTKSLFQMAHLSSFHSRSLDDLSSRPLPYRLVHSMLQTNLRGYTFLRVINKQDSAAENKFAHQPYGELKVFDPGSNNQVTGSQEIFYNQLDRYQQEQVLTDYLLQSTVHHAFKVQQLQSLLDAKAHQPVINLSNLPANEPHPCPNSEFRTKTKRRKAFRAHYRKLERGKNISLPPLVHNLTEPDSSCTASPPSSPRIVEKDSKTGTLFPTISQKPVVEEPHPNPKICRMPMLPSIQTVPVPPATAIENDEDAVNFADHLPLVPTVNIEPPTRQNSSISGTVGKNRLENQKEYKTSEASDDDDDLWISLARDRISPTTEVWDKKTSMEELSTNKVTVEPEDDNLLKRIEATNFSSLNLSPTLNKSTKQISKANCQLTAANKIHQNQRKRSSRKGFVNVPDVKGSIIQAPGGEIIHVGGSLVYKRTVLPEIPSIAKESEKMEDELKRPQNEQSRWPTPLPDIGNHFPTEEAEIETGTELRTLSNRREEAEIETGTELRTLSNRRAESSLSLLSAPKVVEMLTKNAHRMASFILNQDGTGKDLDDDIKLITREVSFVLSNQNGVSLQDGNQMLQAEDAYSQAESETGPTNTVVSLDDKSRRPSSVVSVEKGLETVLVAHSLKSSSPASGQLTPPQNMIDSDVLSDLLGGVKPGHLYQAGNRGSSPLTNASIPNQRNIFPTAVREMEVTTLQPVNTGESESTDNIRQMNSNGTSPHESKNQKHFKLKEEENLLDEDVLGTKIVVRRLSQNMIQSLDSGLQGSGELRQRVEKRGSGEEKESTRGRTKEMGAFVEMSPPSPEDGVSRNIVIKMPEMIHTEENEQETSTEEPDTASIEEEVPCRAMESYQKIFGSANVNQETAEASDRKLLCSPCPDPDPTERPHFASSTSKRPTPGWSTNQNDANLNLMPKTKRGKNAPKEEFKVSRVDYTSELKRLYSQAENTKVKTADIKHDKSKTKERKTVKDDKSKTKERKTVKAKSKPSKKKKLSKKHKSKNKSTNKSLDEADGSEDKSPSQWESEERTSGMDATFTQAIQHPDQSLTDRSRNIQETDAISTWIQDATDKLVSDVSDNEKGDNSGSSEFAVREMEENTEDDSDKDVADEQKSELSESEEQKKMMLELQRILTPKDAKTEELPQRTETKSPEVAAYNMISSQEARAAERRARAAKRREQVERKRKEREEQLRREKEMAERQEKLRQELEEQRRLLEEERRLRKQEEEEERRRLEEEELARELKRLQEVEAEKRRKEEHMRKLRQLKMQQLEEERKRQELLKQQKEEEEERRKAEEEMLAQMAEQERVEYEKKRQEEEEQRMREEEEKRIRQEAEAKQLMEEAVRLAQENAKRQAELEARFQFTQTLHAEAVGLNRCQAVTRAFVFSYFELLTLLGIENIEQQQSLLGEIP